MAAFSTSESHEIANFFGVYLLYCVNPRYKGHTYIGFTVDPNRRIQQHNRGTQAGGAKRTSGRGPWEMVLIIHGFPNQISALRFEWAWQNPDRSRRLRYLTGKKKSETAFQFKFRVVSHMLRSAPWNRLPLTIRWLKQEYKLEFDPDLDPPIHMGMAYGPVQSKKVKAVNKGKENPADQDQDNHQLPLITSTNRCTVCRDKIQVGDAHTLSCLHTECSMVAHTLCLAKHFLRNSRHLIPVEGKCPACHRDVLWGNLIRKKMGCYDMAHQKMPGDCSEEMMDSQS